MEKNLVSVPENVDTLCTIHIGMISSSHNNKEIFGFLERFFFFVFYHEELRHPYIQTVCYVLFPYVNTSNVICCIVCCFTKGGSVSPMYDN